MSTGSILILHSLKIMIVESMVGINVFFILVGESVHKIYQVSKKFFFSLLYPYDIQCHSCVKNKVRRANSHTLDRPLFV